MHKAVIIGCGKIAGLYEDMDNPYVYSHARAYYVNSDVEVVCYCDGDKVRADTLAKKFGSSSASDSYEAAILEYRPDIVSVCTPDDTHFDIAYSILSLDYLPKVIFLEKPACKNRDQFDELLEISKRKGVEIVVNHTRRFDNTHRLQRDRILSGEYGAIVKVDAIYYGGWNHNGVHTIDTLGFLFGDEVLIKDKISQFSSEYDGDHSSDFKCSFKNNDAMIYVTTMDEKQYQLFEFDLKFEKARIRLEDFGQRIVYEELAVNEMGERVLVKKDFNAASNGASPMQNAVDIIVSYLNATASLRGYLISDISNTMNTIWEGNKWAQ